MKREQTFCVIQFIHKLVAIDMNMNHLVALNKNQVYIYSLSGITFIGRLNLDYHLGRVVLSPNLSGDNPLLLFSNSVEKGIVSV